MTIGKLAVILGLDSAKFSAGMKDATRKTGTLGKGLVLLRKHMLAVTAAIAAGSAIVLKYGRDAMRLADSVSAQIDSTRKFAEQIGMTTQGLQQFQFAAGQSGVAARDFDLAMQRMTRRISSAAVGQGSAVKALQELGLNAGELVRLDPGRQFMRVADAMQQVGNQSDRVRLAFALFDSGGVKTLRMMETGAAGITEQLERHKQLYGELTQAQIEAATSFQDSVGELSAAFDGLRHQIANQLIPEMEKLLKLGTSMAGAPRGTGRQVSPFLRGIGAAARVPLYMAGAVINEERNMSRGMQYFWGANPQLGGNLPWVAEEQRQQAAWRAGQAAGNQQAAARRGVEAQNRAIEKRIQQERLMAEHMARRRRLEQDIDKRRRALSGMEARRDQLERSLATRVPPYQLATLIRAGSQESFRLRATHGQRDPQATEEVRQTRELKRLNANIEQQTQQLNKAVGRLREEMQRGQNVIAQF